MVKQKPSKANIGGILTKTPLRFKDTRNQSHKHHGTMKNLMDESRRDRYFEMFAISVLLILGTYHSLLYFGYKLVPTSDFPAFVKIGHELLSFKLPSSFKRAPVLGLLQALLSNLVGGQHPDLTAGWLLNAILHPLIAVLLWLVGRRIIGQAALWIAIIAIINPWVISSLSDPIAETTLLFFVLLTFYFILRRSKWSYLFASITTMVRYEGAALILCAFVMDMIIRKTSKERLMAFLYSALASLPLLIWLGATFMSWQDRDSTHYLRELGAASGGKFVLPEFIELLWKVGFRPLLGTIIFAKAGFAKPSPAEIESMKIFFGISQIFVAVGFIFGAVYGLFKRQWNILALLIFLVSYLLVHALHAFVFYRFMTTVFWIALFILWFGLQSFWGFVDRGGRVPKGLVLVLQALVAITAVIWIILLVPYLSRLSQVSHRSVYLPYVTMILVGVIFAVRFFIYKYRHFLREFSILAVSCLLIASNQFTLVMVLGDGQRDKEFRLLANWYVANARPGEKMVCYMSGTVRIFAPKYAEYFVGIPKADNPIDFVQKCYEQDITYVVWASREMLTPNSMGYRRGGLANIALLYKGENIGPYRFVTQVGSRRGWLNIFRLQQPN